MSDIGFRPPPNPGDTLQKVLVIKLGALGDFMQALGAMRVVRATHPSAQITLLTTKLFGDFARTCPYFDIVDDDGRPRDLKGRTALIQRMRQANYDMVYDFQNNDRTAQYFAGLTGKRPLWSGAAPGASHQHRNPRRGAMHNFDRLAEQLEHAGLGPKPAGDPSGWTIGNKPLPWLDWVRPALHDAPRLQPEFFGLPERYALLIPGSSPKEPEKRWPMDRFAAIAGWLADQGIAPVILGGPSEDAISAQIAASEPRAKNLVGQTDLFQLATLSERAVMAIGGDTGPMHLAVAAGAPSLCLFAQAWTHAMEQKLGSVWNPDIRLGHAAPTGRGPTIILTASSLDMLQVEDIRRAADLLMSVPDAPEDVDAWLANKPELIRRSDRTFGVIRYETEPPAGLLAKLRSLVAKR